MVFGLNGTTPTRSSTKSSVSSLGIPSPSSNRDATDGSNRKKRAGTKESSTTNMNGHVEPAEDVALMNGLHCIRNLDSGQMLNEDDEAAVYFTKTVKKNSPISTKGKVYCNNYLKVADRNFMIWIYYSHLKNL